MSTHKQKTVLGFLSIFILVLGVIAYLLADRYLIERIEVDLAQIPTAETSPAPHLADNLGAGSSSSGVLAQPVAAQAVTAAPVAVRSDDWNYQSPTVSLAIQKVTSGSGKNTLTYFVADVLLKDAIALSSAFAKNQFGKNIIEYTSQIARANQAVFAVNGDYYGFRGDGIIIRNGVIYRDVPARAGLALYRDGTLRIYDETKTTAQELLKAGVWNTLSFGPALLEQSVVAANLDNVKIDANLGNRSIQGNNPRTGIGIIAPNHFVFVVVDGRSPGYSRGASLTEFAEIFKNLGCTDAYNIDGGGSSTMYFMGRVVNNPLGENKERGTSDILFIGS